MRIGREDQHLDQSSGMRQHQAKASRDDQSQAAQALE